MSSANGWLLFVLSAAFGSSVSLILRQRRRIECAAREVAALQRTIGHMERTIGHMEREAEALRQTVEILERKKP